MFRSMAAILSEIESVANQIKLRIDDMKPQKIKKVGFQNNFPVSLAVDGTLSSIIQFLYTLQNSPHYFDIDELYFEKGAMRTSQVKCRLILSKTLIP